jgi:hypothetical protein
MSLEINTCETAINLSNYLFNILQLCLPFFLLILITVIRASITKSTLSLRILVSGIILMTISTMLHTFITFIHLVKVKFGPFVPFVTVTNISSI